MANSSSSSSSAVMRLPKKNHYDVFVSFRGTDTRFNFTDHLFAAFRRKALVAFRDDTKLQKGESIAPKLFHAIEASLGLSSLSSQKTTLHQHGACEN
jgi:hypothetical protein